MGLPTFPRARLNTGATNSNVVVTIPAKTSSVSSVERVILSHRAAPENPSVLKIESPANTEIFSAHIVGGA